MATVVRVSVYVEIMLAPPVDTILRETESVQIGAFRCPVRHPTFVDSGPIRNHCFVFPRTPVVIRHRDDRPFAADPTLVTMYNRGQEYRRAPVSPDGDLCDWYAVSDGVLREALAAYDAGAADDPERPIRFAFTRIDGATYLRQRQLFNEARQASDLDALYIDESVVELLDRVLAYAYRIDQSGRHRRRSGVDLAQRVCELVGRRFVEPLTLPDIARAVGASTFHLCRTFRRVTGLTMHAYRNQLRLRSALDRRSIPAATSASSRSRSGFRATATSRPASGRRSASRRPRRAFWSAQYPDSRSFRRHAVIAHAQTACRRGVVRIRDHGRPARASPARART